MYGRSLRLAVALILLIPMAIIVAVIIAALTGAFSGTYYWWPMHGMMGIGWVFMLIPLTILIVVFLLLLLAATRPDRWRPLYWGPWGWNYYHGGFDPERILDERYARGELPRDEYMRMKDDLRAGRK